MAKLRGYETRIDGYEAPRPLQEHEIRDHLPQNRPSLSAPWYQLSVIQMNSTFLECVDKLHGIRGTPTTGALVGMIMAFEMLKLPLRLLSDYPSISPEKQSEALWAGIGILLIGLLLYALFIWLLRLESFRYTHFPMRFNRKTRMVHVFRFNGTVLSVPWDKIYFTLGYITVNTWEVIGHVLSEDGKTVLETFALSTRDTRNDSNPETTLYQQWEFVRRYMENGPQELMEQVDVVLPIDKKKESYMLGFWRIFQNAMNVPGLMIIMSPLLFLGTIGRWVCMRTCKIPRWPEYVEAECQIEPGDPYIRE